MTLHLPGLGPSRFFFSPLSLARPREFFGQLIASADTAILFALIAAGLLLISRVLLRRDGLAWGAVAVAAFLLLSGDTSGLAPAYVVSSAVVMSALTVAAVRTGGLLSTLVQFIVSRMLLTPPLTLDIGRWYAWRSWFVVAIVVALAVWGFRNVLGKQSAFPAGALDG